jgi:hypothetical protein
MAETVNVIWGNREAEYFRKQGWTGFCARGVFCPSGKSLARKISKNSLFYSEKSLHPHSEARASANPESHFATEMMMP